MLREPPCTLNSAGTLNTYLISDHMLVFENCLFSIHARVCIKRVSKPYVPWFTDTKKLVVRDR